MARGQRQNDRPPGREELHFEVVRVLIDTLFVRFPELCGFSVRGCEDGGLFVDDIGVSPGLQSEHYEEIFREIVVAVAEMVCEVPDANTILRGRTFARVLH